MSDVREKLRIQRPRCPYCHDDIVGGADNRACRECLAWHHTGCWVEHGSCVTCGHVEPTPRAPTPETLKDHEDMRRADAGPKEEPPCKHKFNPMDYKCDYCHKDQMEVVREVFGATVPEHYVLKMRRESQHRRARVLGLTDTLDQHREQMKARRARRRSKDALLIALMVAAFVFGIIKALISGV